MTQDISWHEHRQGQKMWTANVGKIACTIMPPKRRDPLPYYWWETAGPAPYWNRRGGASDLEGAKRMVAESIEECAKKAARDPANITNLSIREVGI
jgi:hypothetical protein